MQGVVAAARSLTNSLSGAGQLDRRTRPLPGGRGGRASPELAGTKPGAARCCHVAIGCSHSRAVTCPRRRAACPQLCTCAVRTAYCVATGAAQPYRRVAAGAETADPAHRRAGGGGAGGAAAPRRPLACAQEAMSVGWGGVWEGFILVVAWRVGWGRCGGRGAGGVAKGMVGRGCGAAGWAVRVRGGALGWFARPQGPGHEGWHG